MAVPKRKVYSARQNNRRSNAVSYKHLGLGAPYWDMYARGALLGVTRGTSKAVSYTHLF